MSLQGFDASDCKNFWVGYSYFLPGGGTEHTATPLEKVYVCIDGEITIITDDGEEILRHLDSCYLSPDEARSIANRTNKIATDHDLVGQKRFDLVAGQPILLCR